EVDQDAGFRAAMLAGPGLGGRTEAKQLAESESQHRERAGLEKSAPLQTGQAFPVQRFHDGILFGGMVNEESQEGGLATRPQEACPLRERELGPSSHCQAIISPPDGAEKTEAPKANFGETRPRPFSRFPAPPNAWKPASAALPRERTADRL